MNEFDNNKYNSDANNMNNMNNMNGMNGSNGANGTNNMNSRNVNGSAYNANANTNANANMNANPNYRSFNEYAYSNGTQNSQNEFAYEPPKKKKSRKALNAILAVLCVCAIGASSIVGYSLINDRISVSSSSSSDSDSGSQKAASADDSSSQSSIDRSNLPTLEQVAAPSDAMSIPDIVTKLSPSVVGISCITDGSQVSGTGIVMSEDGYIITNAHVVEGASAISVVITDSTSSSTTESTADDSSKSVAEQIIESQENSSDSDDNTITAELVGMDTQTDLAVLKIDADGLTPAEFGKSSDIQVGEISIVIGNPLGFDLANTVTAGIISATDRTLTIEDRTMNLIQTDASINSGNSGGPLINAYGQVIGITSAKVSSTYGEGLGFAIPIDDAKEIINDLIEYGYVTGRPTLGISGQNIDSFYAQYYNVPQGFIVMSVEEGSAAEEAGIKKNDLIVGIQGQLISSIEDFNEIKSEYKAGDTISVSVYRDGNIVDLDVTLGEAKDTDSTTTDDSSSEDDNNYNNYYNNYGNGDDELQQFYNYYGNR
jgi:serine protease Do